MTHSFNGAYTGDHTHKAAFPLGGIGTGMFCLEGTGGFSHVSLRHHPEVFNAPRLFAAVGFKGDKNAARVLEGPVPGWKVTFPWGKNFDGSGGGLGIRLFGLPRFRDCRFNFRFPFAEVALQDDALPCRVAITGWSPFVPGDADTCSLPAAVLEYTLTNTSDRPIEPVFSFHAPNFMHEEAYEGDSGTKCHEKGFTLWQKGTTDKPWHEGACRVTAEAGEVSVNGNWFRGGWFDTNTLMWKSVEDAEVIDRPADAEGKGQPGASLYVPLRLEPGESKTIPLHCTWYVPQSGVSVAHDHLMQEVDGKKVCVPGTPRYAPWYAGRFGSIDEVHAFFSEQASGLRQASKKFSDTLYACTLPDEVMEAVGANLSILKSPTVLRQEDGRFWAWEGCCDGWGCCHGSCTHVWNYAQALPHLIPTLERSLRDTEFIECQDDRGHQNFRASLPISRLNEDGHRFHAAADGQLGGIMKMYRDWRISGDTDWLLRQWPRMRRSLDYCRETWDPGGKGCLAEPHHNTYDIEFWGADGMCTSFYLGALKAAILIGGELGEDVTEYEELYRKGRAYMESELFNGEYFIQNIQWKGLKADDPVKAAGTGLQLDYSPEALELLQKEGPKYQYGNGILSDGVLGAWMAEVCGVGEILDPVKVESHLLAVHKYNFRPDLSGHANPQRPSYALGNEGGLLVCSWPAGDALTLPFVYSNEVWTGIEYQVASHLMLIGQVEKGLEIVRACRSRYDGRIRNPLNEYECGHWYARALSSYALLQGLSGIRYDKVSRTLYMTPSVDGDFCSFLSTDGGYGLAGIRNGEPFLEVREGHIGVDKIIRE